jgi:hypothetical protein
MLALVLQIQLENTHKERQLLKRNKLERSYKNGSVEWRPLHVADSNLSDDFFWLVSNFDNQKKITTRVTFLPHSLIIENFHSNL